MTTRQTFFDRLRYGKHTFANGDYVYAKQHLNPDGTKGGWVAETALVEKNCTVGPDAEVYEYAQVCDKASVLGSSAVYGFARVAGNAVINDWAAVNDGAIVQGSAYIGNGAVICSDSYIDYGIIDKDKSYETLCRVKDEDEENSRNQAT